MASSDTPKTILLRGCPQELELVAAGAITPGMLVERASATTVQANGTAADASASAIFAKEQSYAGGAIDDDYAADDQVTCLFCQNGDHVYGLLEDEGNVAAGAVLESDGAGALQALSTGRAVARALEAVDNTGGTGAVRIKVEVIA